MAHRNYVHRRHIRAKPRVCRHAQDAFGSPPKADGFVIDNAWSGSIIRAHPMYYWNYLWQNQQWCNFEGRGKLWT